MSTVWIEEYSALGTDQHGRTISAPSAPSLVANQAITLSGSSQQSAAFNAATQYIRIHSDAACNYAVGSNPTASSSTSHLPSGVIIDLVVTAGNKIAVIS